MLENKNRESPVYYAILLLIGLLILGPLAGVSAAYMNFKLGFYLGGSVLAGILGSFVSIFYGARGRHGANYIQTLASAVGSMGGMCTILQAMHWLKLPEPAAWVMVLLLLSAGLFGVGVGMMYTPLLVDRWKLQFPSGKAVADILRALTDKDLFQRSVIKLFSGMGFAFILKQGPQSWIGGLMPAGSVALYTTRFSSAVVGAGMIVGARITIPALMAGVVGELLTPYLKSIGWLQEGQIFRDIGFIVGLAMILGAAVVHIVPILGQGFARLKADKFHLRTDNPLPLILVVVSGLSLFLVCVFLLKIHWLFVMMGLALTVVFIFINGISTGISDSNPISSAFVLTLLVMVVAGLSSPLMGLLAAGIVLIGCTVGVDMQQDRSTGWRLGTDRNKQLLFQLAGILMGAPFAVLISNFFFANFPVLMVQGGSTEWESAMTLKLVGILEGIGGYEPHKIKALALGFLLGLIIELMRRILRRPDQNGNLRFSKNDSLDFTLDALIFPTPFASSFGCFFSLPSTFWFGIGGVISSTYDSLFARETEEGVPSDMSGPSLVGGGFIAGETMAYVWLGLSLMGKGLF